MSKDRITKRVKRIKSVKLSFRYYWCELKKFCRKLFSKKVVLTEKHRKRLDQTREQKQNLKKHMDYSDGFVDIVNIEATFSELQKEKVKEIDEVRKESYASMNKSKVFLGSNN